LADGLEKEWDLRKKELEGKEIVSIYFGGGTPSLFGPKPIQKILGQISNLSQGCEITIEANPEEADAELLREYHQIGINRLSLGVQSLDDRSLQTLERSHSAAKAKEAILSAKDAGFDNISIDLMYDLPDQTEASFCYTLDQVAHLPIQHLSLYNLTIEPHTSFHRRKETLLSKLPSPSASLKLLQAAIQTLEKAGLKRYEISAFGKPSKHNSGYWAGREFLGFGPSAFSFWKGSRFRNVANIQRYAKSLKEGRLPIDFEETLYYPANLKERLAVQLRLLEGVDLSGWNLSEEMLNTLSRLEKEGFLQQQGPLWKLSEKGTLFYDTLASEII